MTDNILVNGKTYFIREGRVSNVPAGPGGKLTTISMLTKDKQIVESVGAFQNRVQQRVDDAASTTARQSNAFSTPRELRSRAPRSGLHKMPHLARDSKAIQGYSGLFRAIQEAAGAWLCPMAARHLAQPSMPPV